MAAKILIVDDDPDTILFLSTVLQDHGYQTLEATNGDEALQKIRADLPDLILLDLMMPKKSGIALLSELKDDEALKSIPVIMVTGVAGETGIHLESFFEKTSESQGHALGSSGYIEKPVDPEKLLNMVGKYLAS